MLRTDRLSLALAAMLAFMGTRPMVAQGPPILPSTHVVLAGPLSLYPTIALRDAGTDSNVYNEAAAPKEDFTYKVSPGVYAVLPIGRSRVIGRAMGDFVYYRTYKDQQSVNAVAEGRYEVSQGRVRPFASLGYDSLRERPDREIDARVRWNRSTLMMGGDVQLTPITALTGWVQRQTMTWDPGQEYLGVPLARELDSTIDVAAFGARYRLSPLTTILVTAELQRDRFELSPGRDANSIRIGPSIELADGGAIFGYVRAGYRRYTPLNKVFEGYTGPAVTAGVRYTIPDYTRLYVEGGRDVRNSFDPLQPYYLETGLGLKVIQRLVGPIEGIGVVERWNLRHQRLSDVAFDGRREDTTTLGGGVGFLVNDQLELTFVIDRTRRSSTELWRNYEQHRVLFSATYGL